MTDIAGTPDPAQTIRVQRQRLRLRAWVKSRLWAQVVAGMLAGLGVGVVLSPDVGLLTPSVAENLGRWLALPAQIFLGLIAMVLVPLIFASIVGGLTGARSGADLKAIGLRFAIFVILTTVAAATTGVVLANWLKPGAQIASTAAAGMDGAHSGGNEVADGGGADDAKEAVANAFSGMKGPDIIASLLPVNPTASIAQGDMLAVVVLALLLGLAASQVERSKVEPFLQLLDALLSVSMTIVKWAMFLAPFAVFGLMAQLVMRIGLETLVGLSAYVGTVLLGLAVLMFLYLLIVAVAGRISPVHFLRISGGTLLLAFSTSSSSAIMPMSMATAQRLGVPAPVRNLVIPLGATMNMAGTALYQSVAILFLAQMAGIDLGMSQTILLVATLVAASIGAPGTPGVSIAILMSVAATYGIPLEGMVIVLGVDRLLDMSRTTVNVSGDLVACVVLRNSAGVQLAAEQPG
ncbi:MAG: dicarboxylate/amino acid:cation symporter [Parvibaculum sp.]|uniref:dicarboxylate/amino acid:cation symporter n=1 Tax=Parvibaculum sp. TaxID=2024848 RepID=UPI00271F272B|nr:dicarboxylate/amino acid:cation symporter [Parvibaculum sp.]MDO8838378.1 dicarboxylate/amino acid:cation symporter [Parvibaculum sp.]